MLSYCQTCGRTRGAHGADLKKVGTSTLCEQCRDDSQEVLF